MLQKLLGQVFRGIRLLHFFHGFGIGVGPSVTARKASRIPGTTRAEWDSNV